SAESGWVMVMLTNGMRHLQRSRNEYDLNDEDEADRRPGGAAYAPCSLRVQSSTVMEDKRLAARSRRRGESSASSAKAANSSPSSRSSYRARKTRATVQLGCGRVVRRNRSSGWTQPVCSTR